MSVRFEEDVDAGLESSVDSTRLKEYEIFMKIEVNNHHHHTIITFMH